MQHVHFFYFFMTFSIGVVSLGIVVTTYFKTKNPLLQYYLYFYAAFTLLVVLNTFLTYIRINMAQIHPYIYEPLDYVESCVAQYVLMFTISVFIHYFFSVPHPRIRNIILAGISIGASLGEHVFELLVHNDTIEEVGEYIEDVVFLSVLLYAFFTGIYYYRTLQDQERKRLAITFLILFGIFLPGTMNDIFLTGRSPFRFYPMLYCGFSIIFTYHFLKNSFKQHQVAIPNTSDERTDEELFEEYNISPREQEIILLILQGHSNHKIGETLFISLSTVKTHIRNIYQKIGVKSRYELMAFFRNPPEESESTPPHHDR